jgi:predicted Na+-dependent transporter
MVLIRFLDKNFPFLVPIGLLLGMVLGDLIVDFHLFVPWIFAGVTFIGALRIDFDSFRKTIRKPKPIILVMSILRILMPLWALLFGLIVFPGDVYTRTGLLLFSLIPVGVNSVLWTVMLKGNVALTLSVVLLDTLISPLVLPFSMLLLTGASVQLDMAGMMMSLMQMIVLPSLIGMTINQLTKGELPKKWNAKLVPLSKIGLLAVIIINGGTVRDYFTTIDLQLLIIMASIAFLAISGYTMAWNLSKLLKLNDTDAKAVVFSGGMRNVSTGIVIAVVHFPAGAALPVVTGIFFQQIVCATIARMLEKHYGKKESILN